MTARLLLLLPLVYLASAAADPLAGPYYASRCSVFSGVGPDELRQAQTVFQQALRGEDMAAPELAAAWHSLGFAWFELQGSAGHRWVARERDTDCRGRGFYLFDATAETDTVLQVPHRFKDTATGVIALKLAQEGAFRAIAWNTVPRVVAGDGQEQDADLAHRWDSYFTAFTRAVAVSLPQGRVIQLHGFAPAKRTSAAAAGADIIVSAGGRWPSAAARDLADCLRARFPGTVRLFPSDVAELGGTTNVQGKLLRSLGHAGFVHLELSADLRTELVEEAPVRARLCHCLEDAR
jgi:hypothetical protein